MAENGKKQTKKGAQNLAPETREKLTRLNALWRWRGNSFQWAGWLLRQGARDETIVMLASRLAKNKIRNPWAMREIAHVITQNVNYEQYRKEHEQLKAETKKSAPELLREILARAAAGG